MLNSLDNNVSFTSYIKPTKYFESGVNYVKKLADKKDFAGMERFCNAVEAIKNDGKKGIFEISVEKGWKNLIRGIKREKILYGDRIMSDKILSSGNDGLHCYNSVISYAKEYLGVNVDKMSSINNHIKSLKMDLAYAEDDARQQMFYKLDQLV